jgi:tetratricopeptide (TPR) repeat protein
LDIALRSKKKMSESKQAGSVSRNACWSVLVVGLVSAWFLVGCGGNPQAKAQQFLQRARQAAKEGKTNEAILDYRRAIQYQPKAAGLHVELAKFYVHTQDYLSAYKELSIVLKMQPKNWEAREELAELMMRGGDAPNARAEAEQLLKEKPDDIPALLVLARSALGLKNYNLVLSTTAHILQLDPKNDQAWFFQGLGQIQSGRSEDAEASLRKAAEYHGDSVLPATMLAGLLLKRGDTKGAEQVIDETVQRNPNSIPGQYLLASFLLQEKRWPEAEQTLKKISVLGENNPKDRGVLARYHVLTGKRALAESEYAEILKKHPDDSMNRRQLAGLYAMQGQTPTAVQLLDDGLKLDPKEPNLILLRGQLRVGEGQVDEGIGDLKQAAQLSPKSPLPPYFLGLAELREGNRELAKASLNSALDLDPNFMVARLVLAQMALKNREPGEAMADLEGILEKKPTVVEPYLLRAMALVEQGQAAQAEKNAIPLLQEFPQPAARMMTFDTLAWISISQSNFEQAHKFAQQALGIQPRSRDALYVMGLARFGAKQVDQGLAEVGAHVRANPNWAAGYDVLGQLEVLAGHAQKGEQDFEQALQLAPQLTTARLGLSQAQVAQGKLDQAVATLTPLTQRKPPVAEADIRLGQIAEMKGNWNAAEASYQKALELAPDNIVAKNNLAWSYAEHGGNIDVALKLAQEAKESNPDNPNVSDTLGWILVKKQNYGTAVQILRAAVQENPQKALYQYHLGVAYFQAHEQTNAKRALEAALRIQPDFSDAARAKQLLATLNK